MHTLFELFLKIKNIIYFTKARWRIGEREPGPSPSITGVILAVAYTWYIQYSSHLVRTVLLRCLQEQIAPAYTSMVCIHVCVVVFIHSHTCGGHRLMWGSSRSHSQHCFQSWGLLLGQELPGLPGLAGQLDVTGTGAAVAHHQAHRHAAVRQATWLTGPLPVPGKSCWLFFKAGVWIGL